MGWLMPNGEEKFTVADMVRHLELEDISLGDPSSIRTSCAGSTRATSARTTTPMGCATCSRPGRSIARCTSASSRSCSRAGALGRLGSSHGALLRDEVPLPAEDLPIRGMEGARTAEICR